MSDREIASKRYVEAAVGRLATVADIDDAIRGLTDTEAAKTYLRLMLSAVCTTAERPSAASWPIGIPIYDTTISRPIWSDGTHWRDAAGNIA